jgi:hypothetical protein
VQGDDDVPFRIISATGEFEGDRTHIPEDDVDQTLVEPYCGYLLSHSLGDAKHTVCPLMIIGV